MHTGHSWVRISMAPQSFMLIRMLYFLNRSSVFRASSSGSRPIFLAVLDQLTGKPWSFKAFCHFLFQIGIILFQAGHIAAKPSVHAVLKWCYFFFQDRLCMMFDPFYDFPDLSFSPANRFFFSLIWPG